MADRQPVSNHARCLLVNRIHLEQEEDKEGDGGREEGEQGPDHGLDRAKVEPAKPRNMATRAPEMAEPNFWAMVPEEKIRPVEEVPFLAVA